MLVEQGMPRHVVTRRLGQSHARVSKAVRRMDGIEAIQREAVE